ncbi:MAG: alcohol dehydrogenase catalytic domain-containing protein [Spirochaetaceae bacterium]|nr:alcohol dehydrogenase catalytic domain-containing protein [Spirochaetaceae bacterium]
MNKTMKAVVVRAPMDFSVETVPIPKVSQGGLLLKVLACGLCGSDLRTLRMGHRKVTFPWTIGHEISGEIVEVGSEYSGDLKNGDILAVGPLAYCGTCDFCQDGEYELCENQKEIGQHWPGGFAEYIAIPEENVLLGNIQKVPEGGDPVIAAITEPVSSCVNAQEKADIKLGETVVIIGTGPIGCIHISLARARGARKIFVVDISADRLKLAEAFEPDALINGSECDPVEEVMKLTEGRGAHVVIAAAPAPQAAVQAVEMARKGGRVIQFGGMPKDNCKPGVDMNIVHYRGLHIIGTTTFAPRHNRIALNLLLEGIIPADKLVTHTFPLENFVEGAKLALEGKVLKGVFIP